MKCPKCGGEMKRDLYNINPKPKGVIGLNYNDLRALWRCKCGHEEKLKDGEK